MVGWEDVYKVAEAMAPLYTALILGYGAVRWWHMFTPDHCAAIDRFVCYFILPLYTFDFTASIDPFKMNYRFIAADAISKCITVATIGVLAKCGGHGSWGITSFCLASLSNTLIVGLPLMKAMYGQLGVDLLVQASVVQCLLWFSFLLFILEFRDGLSQEDNQFFAGEKSTITNTVGDASVIDEGKDLEGNQNRNAPAALKTTARPPRSFGSLMKVVLRKLATNPNSYACFIGIAWAFFSSRFHFKTPNIVEGSVLIMSRAGTGTAMFSMGLFTGMQERIIASGAGLTVFGLVLRFIAGPATMAIGAIAVGLRGNVLRIAIMQAAMPQSITSFIYAKQYGSQLHSDVISTAVIFGTMVSLPVLMAYYAALESLH